MKNLLKFPTDWLPSLNHQVWLLALGRLLSQTGSGFTLFYAPIFFVNQVHLSATAVGLGLGSASITGIVGRIVGGSLADSSQFGRRKTLMLAVLVAAIGSLLLALTVNFSIFIVGNLLMGLGIGLYWPANEAMVADLTSVHQRNEAFAVTRLADNLGLGLGVILGGGLISLTGAYRALFVIDALSFVVFWGVLWVAIKESYQTVHRTQSWLQGWLGALNDRILLVYLLANIVLTTYIAQIQTSVPLYFKNFAQTGHTHLGFSETTLTSLFACHVMATIVLQMPAVQQLKRFTYLQVLYASTGLWGIGFLLVWMTGTQTASPLLVAIGVMTITAMAIVLYTPVAAAFVVALAPESQRGIYLSLNSLCWAIGYLIGPPIGGLALDQPRPWVDHFWLLLVLSVIPTIGILKGLSHLYSRRTNLPIQNDG